MKITIDGLNGLNEMVNVIGRYSSNVARIINSQNWYNLQEAIRADIKDEIAVAGFNEKGKRSVDLAKAFDVERDSSSTKENIVYNMGFNDNYLNAVMENTDFEGNVREGLTGEEMISFMEVGRKAYKIPKRTTDAKMLVFKNKSVKKPGGKLALPIANGQQYDVSASGGGAYFERVVELKLQEVFDRISEKLENEMNNL